MCTGIGVVVGVIVGIMVGWFAGALIYHEYRVGKRLSIRVTRRRTGR